jgi:hypothetical protein
MDFIGAIKERREKAVQRALTLLEMYGSSDVATRETLLPVAGKALADARVARRWMGVLDAEPDQGLRQKLLGYLSDYDFRQMPSDSDCAVQLLKCLEHPDARDWALHCISKLVPREPRLAVPLIEAYRAQRNDLFARNILAVLLGLGTLPPEAVTFLLSLLNDVDEDFKIQIVKRLLELDAIPAATLEKLLDPSEPASIKLLVLGHLADRSIQMDSAAAKLLLRDPNAACRYAAAWLLTETGEPSSEALNALLHAAADDTDERVRRFAIASFEHTLVKTPVVIDTLLKAMRQETAPAHVAMILCLLEPHIPSAPTIVPELMALVVPNLQTETALRIYDVLGTVAPWNPKLQEWLIASYQTENDDRIKAAILKPLSILNLNDPRLSRMYVDALKLPDAELRRWGIEGVLLLAATRENQGAIAACVEFLNVPDIEPALRLQLAHKIALIPEKSPVLLERLKYAAAQAREPQLRQVCEDAVAKATDVSDAKSEVGEPAADWAGWLHRSEIEHRADGIYPAILQHYDDAPCEAQRVLKALLNPQCADNLYSCYGYDFNESHILNLLDQKNAFDDDASRYCIGRVLTQDAGTPDGYLQFLLANPAYAGLKDGIWQILTRRLDASPALLRELLVYAYGDDEAAAVELSARISKVGGAEALRPYVRMLEQNLGWPPARTLLKGLSKHRDLSGNLREQVEKALQKLGVKADEIGVAHNEPKVQAQGPGFADD